MTTDRTAENGERARLHGLERPRYFYGKLMTVRDKQAEHDYHAGRQNLHNRLVTGSGAVCGLDVEVTDAEEGVTVRLEPGVGIDAFGRTVVVPDGVERSMTPEWGDGDEPDRIHLYLRYDWCEREKVPSTGSPNAAGDECEYGRILETFELESREGPPNPAYAERKVLPDIDFPTPADLPNRSGSDGATPAETRVLNRMARSFYEARDLELYEDPDDAWIFLGSYESVEGDDAEATWTEVSGDRPRPLVYRNDMLYAVQARHVTDSEAHGTGELKRQMGLLREYVMNKSTRATLRAFGEVAVRFDSSTAGLVAKTANDTIDEEGYRSERGFLGFLDEVVEHQRRVATELDGKATEASLERYRDAVTDLDEALGRTGPIRRPDVPDFDVDLEGIDLGDVDRDALDLPRFGDRFPGVRVRSDRLTVDLSRLLPILVPRRNPLDLAVLQDEVCEAATQLEKSEAPRVTLPGGYEIPAGRVLRDDVFTPLLDIPRVREIPPLVGVPLPEALDRLEADGIRYRVETRDVPDVRDLHGAGVIDVLEVSPAPESGPGEEVEVVVTVASPPSTTRVRGIGETYRSRLGENGIENIVELATAPATDIARAADVDEETAEEWREEANRLTRAYELTRVEGIGVDDAEALATGANIASVDDLRSASPTEIESRIEDAAEAGELSEGDANRLRRFDWEGVRNRLDSLGPR